MTYIDKHHTEACQRRRLDILQAQVAYDSAWPHYCQHCNGAGWWVQYDHVLHGPPMQVWEGCEHCTDIGLCPRCMQSVGREITEDTEQTCPHCGHDLIDGAARPVWEPDDCTCHDGWFGRDPVLEELVAAAIEDLSDWSEDPEMRYYVTEPT